MESDGGTFRGLLRSSRQFQQTELAVTGAISGVARPGLSGPAHNICQGPRSDRL